MAQLQKLQPWQNQGKKFSFISNIFHYLVNFFGILGNYKHRMLRKSRKSRQLFIIPINLNLFNVFNV